MHLGDSVCLESHHTPEGQRVSLGTACVCLQGQPHVLFGDSRCLKGQHVPGGTEHGARDSVCLKGQRVSRDGTCREGQQLPEGTAMRLVAQQCVLGTARAWGTACSEGIECSEGTACIEGTACTEGTMCSRGQPAPQGHVQSPNPQKHRLKRLMLRPQPASNPSVPQFPQNTPDPPKRQPQASWHQHSDPPQLHLPFSLSFFPISSL